MLLTLQIAAGIVLAYVIIANREPILRMLQSLAGIAAGIAALAAVGFGGFWLLTLAGEYWKSIVSGVVFVASLGLFAVGAYGLVLIFRRLFRTTKPDLLADGSEVLLLLFAMINLALVYAASVPLSQYTPLDSWWADVDQWSRANDFADLWTMFLGSLCSLWPYLIVVPLQLADRHSIADLPEAEKPDA